MDVNSSPQQNDTKLSSYSKLLGLTRRKLTQYTLFNSERELAIGIVIQRAK